MTLSIPTEQIQDVQGPHRLLGPPEHAQVEFEVDLTEKYVGRRLMGLGPYLEVLETRQFDDLICKYGYRLYREMSNDPEVAAALDLLITSSSAKQLQAISPLDVNDPDYKLSADLADFVNYVFKKLDIDEWSKDQLRGALTFGNAVSEEDWDFENTGKWANHFIIKELRKLEPEQYGFIVDQWNKVYGIAPVGPSANILLPITNVILLNKDTRKLLKGAIPLYKLTVWTWQKRASDPRGVSQIKPAWLPWWNKQRSQEEWNTWMGWYGQPSLIASPGPNAIPVCKKDPNTGQEVTVYPTEELANILQYFKSGSVMAVPPGTTVTTISMPSGVDPFLKSISLWNREITRAVLGQHLASSDGEGSNKAGPDNHSIILRFLINNIRTFKANRIQQDIIRPLIEANYGDVGHLMPVVDLGDGDDFPPSVTDMVVAFQAGYFTEDQLPELDKRYGFPLRKTGYRVGPANLPQAGQTDIDAQEKPKTSTSFENERQRDANT